MKSKKVCHGGAHLLGFAVLMVINIRNMKSKKEEHCSPARTLQEFLYMNAFFVSVRILWPGYDLSSRSRRTNALASLAPRLASRALTPWWVQRKAKTGESTTVPGLSFWRSTYLFIISAIPHQLCSSFHRRISFLLLGQLYVVWCNPLICITSVAIVMHFDGRSSSLGAKHVWTLIGS